MERVEHTFLVDVFATQWDALVFSKEREPD